MMVKNIVLLFDDFQKVHFYKDPGMILHYFNKLFGYNVSCVTISKSGKEETEYIDNLKIIRLKKSFIDPNGGFPLSCTKKN